MRLYRVDNINKAVTLSFSFDKELQEVIKKCSRDTHWNRELKYWVVPIDEYSKPRVLDIISTHNFTPAPPIINKYIKFDYSVTDDQFDKLKSICESQDFTYSPRDYQYEALGYALKCGNIINGDGVGVGKTFEAIMYAEATNSFPCLVVTPGSVKDQWLEKWLEIKDNKRSVSSIKSKPKKKEPNNWNSDVVVINYDIIGKKQGTGATVKFQELLDIPWKMIVFDEAHFLKNKKSQRSSAAKRIVDEALKTNKTIVQMLSGTITMSRPIELWNILVIAKINHLIAKDWMQYVTRYCGGYRGKFGWVTKGASNMMELNKKLRETCYLRREKTEVLTELPPVIKSILKVPITNKKEIKQAKDDLIGHLRRTKGLEAAAKAEEAEHLVALGVLRRLAIAGKVKAIERYLKDWEECGRKLVIFGVHSKEIEYLANKFDSKIIAGTNKRKIVKEWMENDEIFLFANIQSAGTGTDGLQEVCSDMLVTELPWRPSDLEQLIGRLHRSGQTEPPSITFALNEDTIDMDMWEVLEDKERVTEAINKGIDIDNDDDCMKSVMKRLLNK